MTNLHAWADETAAHFREFEQIEMAMYPSGDHRDAALVEWVLRVLARPENDGTADVLESINSVRLHTSAVAS